MFRLVTKRNPCSILLPFFAAHRTTHHPHIRGLCSPSAVQNPDSKPSNFSLNDYLIASWGFSANKAARYSKRLTHIKSPEKPDAVLSFLDNQGFSPSQIQNLVTWHPNLLNSCPETIIDPNLNALRKLGLSSSTLNAIILASPGVLQLHSAVPRINFWLDFFHGNELDLVKAFKRSRCLVDLDIGKNILPKISLLKSHGFTTDAIQRMIGTISRFMSISVASIEKLLERAQELGFRPESGMFVLGLQAVSAVSRETLLKKMLLFKRFGWQEDAFLSAFRRTPTMVQFSEESLRKKMDFLLREAGFDLSYVITHSILLLYSVEKRMRPRLHVLHLLESKGLYSKGNANQLCTVANISNNKFLEKYILPHKNEIPELHQVYLAACGSSS